MNDPIKDPTPISASDEFSNCMSSLSSRLGIAARSLMPTDEEFAKLPVPQQQAIIISQGAQELNARISQIVDLIKTGFGIKLSLGDFAVVLGAVMGIGTLQEQKAGAQIPPGLPKQAGLLMQASIEEILKASVKADNLQQQPMIKS